MPAMMRWPRVCGAGGILVLAEAVVVGLAAVCTSGVTVGAGLGTSGNATVGAPATVKSTWALVGDHG